MIASPTNTHIADSRRPRTRGTNTGGVALLTLALLKFYPDMLDQRADYTDSPPDENTIRLIRCGTDQHQQAVIVSITEQNTGGEQYKGGITRNKPPYNREIV